MADPMVLLSEFEAITIPMSPWIPIKDHGEINRITLTCRLGPVSHQEGGVATSLRFRIQYLLASDQVWATEWLLFSVHFQRAGDSWRCRIGTDWSTSTDWPT